MKDFTIVTHIYYKIRGIKVLRFQLHLSCSIDKFSDAQGV